MISLGVKRPRGFIITQYLSKPSKFIINNEIIAISCCAQKPPARATSSSEVLARRAGRLIPSGWYLVVT